MKLWEILVPMDLPDGRLIPKWYHHIWDERVRAISGGLTILTPAKGQWVAPTGDLFTERMIPVRVGCTDSQIEEIADFTAKYYSQLAVMYYCVSNEVYIKHYN